MIVQCSLYDSQVWATKPNDTVVEVEPIDSAMTSDVRSKTVCRCTVAELKSRVEAMLLGYPRHPLAGQDSWAGKMYGSDVQRWAPTCFTPMPAWKNVIVRILQ